jgi:uncharacterized peroxidase-related enzyme
MRPEVLNTGYRLRTKALFKVIEGLSRQSLPDAAKLTFYRPDFYGNPMKKITHKAMRGNSDWSVGERELMAAYVSSVNRSPFCIGAHSATASQALKDRILVDAVLADLDTAPIDDRLRATLRMLGTLTRLHTVISEDLHAVLDAGATTQQIKDALAVCFSFNVTNRVADAFAFQHLTPDGYNNGAKYLLKRGYR